MRRRPGEGDWRPVDPHPAYRSNPLAVSDYNLCVVNMLQGFYTRRILPYLIHAAMRQEFLVPYRQRLASDAEGRVLEIGFGSGLNLPFYTKAASVIGLDSSPELLSMARASRTPTTFPVELLEGSAEAIPLDSHGVDTVVTAWTLCSIRDVSAALTEVRRVLAPSGRLLFVEHGRSPDARVELWQDRLTPLWRRVAGGCHLNRAVVQLIEDAGFRIEQLHTGYIKGPRVLTFLYEGSARPG